MWNQVDECYSLTSEKAKLVTHMSAGRMYAASIVINDNTLWVTGGYLANSYQAYLASTEYVTVTGIILGPDLPMALYHHAMVAINSSWSMVIGGEKSNSYSASSTFFYDRNEEEWIIGPSLMQARKSHAAGIVTDDVTSEHFVAVTGGIVIISHLGSIEGFDYDGLDSTEILQDGKWVQGKINNTICYLLVPKLKILLNMS